MVVQLVVVVLVVLGGVGALAGSVPGLVKVTVDDTAVIQKEFRGIGFQLSAHLAEISAAEMDEVFAKRWQQIDPSHALIAYTDAWDWARTLPFLKRVLSKSDIWLAHGGKAPDAVAVASVIQRLRKEGIKNVTAPPPGVKAIEIGDGGAEEGLKAVDATMAAINSGVSAVTYMSFCDSPAGDQRGMFEWKRPEFRPRAVYYSAGLLAQYVNGPAKVLKVRSDLPDLQLAYLKGRDGLVTLVAVNRRNVPVHCKLLDSQPKGTEMRQYDYCVTNTPAFRFGDMQSWKAGLSKGGHGRGSTFSVPAKTLAVLRTVGDREPPEQVRFVDVSEVEGGGRKLKWEPVVDKDLCYYRVYRMNMKNIRFAKKTHVGSTQGTQFVDKDPPAGKKAYYGVVGVDRSGNWAK